MVSVIRNVIVLRLPGLRVESVKPGILEAGGYIFFWIVLVEFLLVKFCLDRTIA